MGVGGARLTWLNCGCSTLKGGVSCSSLITRLAMIACYKSGGWGCGDKSYLHPRGRDRQTRSWTRLSIIAVSNNIQHLQSSARSQRLIQHESRSRGVRA